MRSDKGSFCGVVGIEVLVTGAKEHFLLANS